MMIADPSLAKGRYVGDPGDPLTLSLTWAFVRPGQLPPHSRKPAQGMPSSSTTMKPLQPQGGGGAACACSQLVCSTLPHTPTR
jgi:hypothetical protein